MRSTRQATTGPTSPTSRHPAARNRGRPPPRSRGRPLRSASRDGAPDLAANDSTRPGAGGPAPDDWIEVDEAAGVVRGTRVPSQRHRRLGTAPPVGDPGRRPLRRLTNVRTKCGLVGGLSPHTSADERRVSPACRPSPWGAASLQVASGPQWCRCPALRPADAERGHWATAIRQDPMGEAAKRLRSPHDGSGTGRRSPARSWCLWIVSLVTHTNGW